MTDQEPGSEVSFSLWSLQCGVYQVSSTDGELFTLCIFRVVVVFQCGVYSVSCTESELWAQQVSVISGLVSNVHMALHNHNRILACFLEFFLMTYCSILINAFNTSSAQFSAF